MTPTLNPDLARALVVAINTHAHQVDKQGSPYLLHIVRVVEAVSDDAKIVAALHDVWEDGPSGALAFAEIVDDDELQALNMLTRGSYESYAEYIDAMTRGADHAYRLAREVKLADLRDNLGRLPELRFPDGPTTHDLRRRYEKAIEVLEAAA